MKQAVGCGGDLGGSESLFGFPPGMMGGLQPRHLCPVSCDACPQPCADMGK
eukprot:gene31495-11102_t